MKIGILTYHACYNYGACLQAYALQQSIKRRYAECDIIDYQSKQLIDINHPFCKVPKHPKEIIKNITRLPYYNQLLRRQKLFEDFINNMQMLSRRCSTDREVEQVCAEYDCIVGGSDQTWNLDPNIRYETPLYYMNFPKVQRRITYATSFGSWVENFPLREKELLPWIEQFDALSMREESGVRMLQSRGMACEWVLDPTLLLEQTDYDKIAEKRIIDEPYVLLFSWNGAEEAVEITKKVSDKLGCKAFYIVPPPRAMFCGIQRKLDVGPREFLSLVKYAEFIVTNSFHGTVFSTIYKKPFISAIKGEVDPRRASLMKQLGLENHLISPERMELSTIMETDFSKVESNIEMLRKFSLSYLYDSLEK